MKHILFTHDDLDGAGCSVVFKLAHPDGEVINCSNVNVDEKVNERADTFEGFDEIFFADICCSKELLDDIHRSGFNLHVFDHHPTNAYAIEVLGEVYATVRSTDENGVMVSGTSLLFDNLKSLIMNNDSHCMKEFITAVREYDTYTFKQTGNMQAKYLQTLFGMLGLERFCKMYVEQLSSLIGCDMPLIDETSMEFIMAKIENEQKVIDSYKLDDIKLFQLGDYVCGLVYSINANFSEFSNQFLTKYPEIDIMVLPAFGKDSAVFQFRAVKDGIDIGKEIAVPMGGGGHPKAAGAPMSDELKNKFYSSILEEMSRLTNIPLITQEI